GGSFGVDWVGYDSWVEGSGGGMGTPGYPGNTFVSYNSISTLYSAGSASLGSFAYTPPGNNVYVDYTLPLNASLASDAAGGGDVSLYFYATDNQVGYLFNARSFGSNVPRLTLSAVAVPEPTVAGLIFMGMGSLPIARGLRRKR